MKHSTFQDASLLALRLIIAAIFLYAGYAKLPLWSVDPASMGMATWLWYVMKLLIIVEPIGAVALAVGFLTYWAALGDAIIMVGSIVVMQFMMHIGFVMPTAPGWEFNLLILASCLGLMAFGAGGWSVDARWRKA